MKKICTLFFFALLAVTAFAVDGDTPPVVDAGPWQPLLDLFGGKAGRVAQILLFIGALRIPVKLFSAQLQAFFERALARVIETSDQSDDHVAAAVLRNPLYRFFAFVVDMVTSLKLPLDLPKKPDGTISSTGNFITSSLLAIGLLSFAFTGCGDLPKNTYKVSTATHAGVKAALSGWNDYLGAEYARIGTNTVERNKLIEKEGKLAEAYEKYQAAQAAALHAAAEFAREPEDATASDKLQTAMKAASRALGDLGAVLTQFGFKVSLLHAPPGSGRGDAALQSAAIPSKSARRVVLARVLSPARAGVFNFHHISAEPCLV